METVDIERQIELLLDKIGFPDQHNSKESDLPRNNALPEVSISLEERACILSRIQASVSSRQQAIFKGNPSLEPKQIEVMINDIPRRDLHQRTMDRKLLREQMKDARLGGLTREECSDLIDIFKTREGFPDTDKEVRKWRHHTAPSGDGLL